MSFPLTRQSLIQRLAVTRAAEDWRQFLEYLLAIQRMDSTEKCLPASAVGGRFKSGLIPLAVERVEGDPLVERDLVGVAHRIKLFDLAHPAARSMKANRGGMLAAFARQPFLVAFPLAA